MSSIYDWSLSADKNANADRIINWQEGQPPSSVNDSARAMMQRISEYMSDLGALVEVSGGASSIELTSACPVVEYREGLVLRFRAKFSNAPIVHINLNRIQPKPVYKADRKEGISLVQEGDIQKGSLYEIIYVAELEENKGAWFLTNPTVKSGGGDASAGPPGMIAAFAMETPPKGWLECDGKYVLRSEYPALFEAIGTYWGGATHETLFKLPDLRGYFLRGWDHGAKRDQNNQDVPEPPPSPFPARKFASTQQSEVKIHKHEVYYKGTINDPDYFPFATSGDCTIPYWNEDLGEKADIGFYSTGLNESRPLNVAVLYAIKI